MEIIDSKPTSNFLKGFAIVTVLINHFLNLHISIDLQGFSNLFVGIFFFQGGQATSFPLSRNCSMSFDLKRTFVFYFQRCLRIFPLLWIAWAFEYFIRNGDLTPWILTGFHTTGHYWFISALFQCYFIAPILFFFLTKNFSRTILIIATIFFLFIIFWMMDFFPALLLSGFDFIHAKWRGIYFLHILFFVFGLSTPFFSSKMESITIPLTNFGISFCFWSGISFIIGFMAIAKIYGSTSSFFNLMFLIGPVPLLALLCVFSFQCLPTNRVFSFFGRISYSLYLFHVSYFLFFRSFDLFHNYPYFETLALLIFLPVFILFCIIFEKFGSIIYRKFQFYFFPSSF